VYVMPQRQGSRSVEMFTEKQIHRTIKLSLCAYVHGELNFSVLFLFASLHQIFAVFPFKNMYFICGFSSRSFGFNSGLLHARLVVGEMTLKQDFLQICLTVLF
jgi:hypothetical protein